MFSRTLGNSLAKLALGVDATKLVRYSSMSQPSWPSGRFPPPGSVPPRNMYPPPCDEQYPTPGYHTPPGYSPPPEDFECPPQCCTPPGCFPPYCPPVSGKLELCEDCRGRRRICPPPCCFPGPVPYNPCCPRFPKANYKKYKRIFLLLVPAILLAALNAFGNEHCTKSFCREYEYMRRRTKRFPWGDGNTTFFHNEHVNHLPEECEPPPMICYPEPQLCD